MIQLSEVICLNQAILTRNGESQFVWADVADHVILTRRCYIYPKYRIGNPNVPEIDKVIAPYAIEEVGMVVLLGRRIVIEKVHEVNVLEMAFIPSVNHFPTISVIYTNLLIRAYYILIDGFTCNEYLSGGVRVDCVEISNPLRLLILKHMTAVC